MRRITPRTCLWPLTGSLLVTFALSIGLTFRSNHHCYAGTCGEWLFPLQARLHVVVWYMWISLSVTFLAIRAFHASVQRHLRKTLIERLPVVGKSLTVSGALIVFWILALYGIIIGIWWLRLRSYFVHRGQKGGISDGNTRVAAVALTGHLCDVTMGMVLLPVARNSALTSFFRLAPSTTLGFHMIQAYVLFALVVTHGLLYASWVAVFNRMSNLMRLVFPVLNPTYLYHEVWPGSNSSLGVWRASLVFTGLLTTLIMGAIFITTLPVVRRKHFNVFYFTHLLVIIAVVIICLHASTMFYCTSPGLAMWVLDWGMRIYELSGKMDSTIAALGNGWFCLTLPLPRRRLDGCACYSPLAHFHIHHSGSSIRELHPFSTITHLASEKVASPKSEESIMIQFLFRKSKAAPSARPQQTGKRREKRPSSQWTNKLAALVDEESINMSPLSEQLENPYAQKDPLASIQDLSLRLEGPYFTPVYPANYNTVICLVAGTGISGAISIAAAFRQQQRLQSGKTDVTIPVELPRVSDMAEPDPSISSSSARPASADDGWKRCVVVWSVRRSDYIHLPFFHADTTPGLEVLPHLTGKGDARLNMEQSMTTICDAESAHRTWVYISGPNPFIEAGERVCRKLGLEYFGARWA